MDHHNNEYLKTKIFQTTEVYINELTEKIIGCAIEVHKAQLLTYMKLAKIKLGLLINFNEKLLKNGIQRFALVRK